MKSSRNTWLYNHFLSRVTLRVSVGSTSDKCLHAPSDSNTGEGLDGRGLQWSNRIETVHSRSPSTRWLGTVRCSRRMNAGQAAVIADQVDDPAWHRLQSV